MKGKIRYACDRDENTIKNICSNAFTLTSLDVDKTFGKGGGEFYFDFYVKLALAKYPSQCFVYEENHNVLGFVLYGVDNITNGIIDKKIGSILLVAVDPFHMDRKIGKTLISYVLRKFDNMGFDLVTVGTDSSNTPALLAYQNEGFRSMLTWSTLRLYRPFEKNEPNIPITVSLEKKADVIYSIVDNTSFIRTHSYFYDRNLPCEKILKRVKDSLSKELEEGQLTLYKVMLDDETIGAVFVRHDIAISNYLQKIFLRIESVCIVEKYEENKYVLSNMFRAVINELPFEIIEVWSANEKTAFLNAALHEGFSLIHTACVLHRWRKK